MGKNISSVLIIFLCLSSTVPVQAEWPKNLTASPAVNAEAAITYTAVTAGSYFTCALTAAGGVRCWGRNPIGGLGNGSFPNRQNNMPADVVGMESGVRQVSAGYGHICAVTTAGGVKCWGANNSGQLGDGTTTDRSVPVDVAGLTGGVSQVAAGSYFTCALMRNGRVKCWGENQFGQLGDGTMDQRNAPVDVVGLVDKVTQLAAGGFHICALTRAGGVKCWGSNQAGQLGDATATNRSTPVDVFGLETGIIQVQSGGVHTCAITLAGGVKCWGSNFSGQLGDGSTTDRSTPVAVTGLAGRIVQLATGTLHTCAAAVSGGV